MKELATDHLQGSPTVEQLTALLNVFFDEETDPPFIARAVRHKLGADFLRFLPEGFDPDEKSSRVIGSI